MKFFALTSAALIGFASVAAAQSSRGFSYGTGSNSNSHYVQPHYNSGSGYVGGHYRTNPDSSRSNNYGSYGNYNPYSGGIGDGYGRSRR